MSDTVYARDVRDRTARGPTARDRTGAGESIGESIAALPSRDAPALQPSEETSARCEMSPCERTLYYVVFDGAWKIQCDGENSESYPCRSDAFRDAVALAHLDGRNGRKAEVIVQGLDDRFRAAWNSTCDAYPPQLVPQD